MTAFSAETERSGSMEERLAKAVPPVLYGLRTSASVCAALFVAFVLELENPNWAGTSAGIVSQPTLGQSVRKGVYRLIGTTVGATATVVLTAVVPQDRVGFLLGMAIWAAACSYVSTLLSNFASYGAMLAGYTMAIIAADSIPAPDTVFQLAISRASEISIGIVCATVVITATDFGHTRRELTAALAGIVGDISAHMRRLLDDAAHVVDDPEPRRALIKRVAALDPLIDQAGGEAAELRYERATLKASMHGLFEAIVGWRAMVVHLSGLTQTRSIVDARPLLKILNEATIARRSPSEIQPDWAARRAQAEDVVRALARVKTDDVSQRILADGAARAAIGIEAAYNGLALLDAPEEARERRPFWLVQVPDHLPALVNAGRVFLAIGIATLFWIVTQWAAGLTAVTFTAVTVLLLSPQQERGAKAAVGFGVGTVIAACVACVVKFAVLPNHDTFLALGLILTAIITPLTALSTVPSLRGVFTGAAMNFIPLLGPTNQTTYDLGSYYEGTLAIVVGCIFGALMMRLIPPVPMEIRALRLAAMARRDLRKLALRRGPMPSLQTWSRKVYARLVALPEEKQLGYGSNLMAALSVGRQVIRLRRYSAAWPSSAALDRAMEALSIGDIAAMTRELAALDGQLAAMSPSDPGAAPRIRARASIQVMTDAMARNISYFEGSDR